MRRPLNACHGPDLALAGALVPGGLADRSNDGETAVITPNRSEGSSDAPCVQQEPPGITTWSQTGPHFGYGRLPSAWRMLPLVITVPEACGQIGNIAGEERR